MADVVAGLAVFGAVIAVGWLLVRTRAVPADADGVLTRVCFFAATPALLVTTLSRADLTAVLSRSTAVAVAALCCVGVRHGSSLPFLSGNPLFVVRGFRSRAPFDW